MKKSILTTFCLVIIVALMSFTVLPTDIGKEQQERYFCFYSVNHMAEQFFISNVFYCDEYPNDLDCSKYIENELDYNLESYENTRILSHQEKSYVYDDRNDEISWAKGNGYKVIKFNVYCDKSGKIYPKD